MKNEIIIITGNKGDGKTTKLKNIVDLLRAVNVGVAGFVAVGEWQKGERSKYTLVDLVTGKLSTICTKISLREFKQKLSAHFKGWSSFKPG